MVCLCGRILSESRPDTTRRAPRTALPRVRPTSHPRVVLLDGPLLAFSKNYGVFSSVNSYMWSRKVRRLVLTINDRRDLRNPRVSRLRNTLKSLHGDGPGTPCSSQSGTRKLIRSSQHALRESLKTKIQKHQQKFFYLVFQLQTPILRF